MALLRDWIRLALIIGTGLIANGASVLSAQPSRPHQTVVSPSERIRLDAYSFPIELYISKPGLLRKRTLLYSDNYSQHRGISSVEFSPDERFIVMFWGGGSIGDMVDVFEKNKAGAYKPQKFDIAIEAWRQYAKTKRFRSDAEFIRLHCTRLAYSRSPFSVLFALTGRHDSFGKPQPAQPTQSFGPVYFEYFPDQSRLKMIPRPSKAR